MLFPHRNDSNRYWRLVAATTTEGKLRVASKVATLDALDPVTLICVYTYDFTDIDDVRLVLEKLVELDLCQTGGRPIYYKCDAYTYLDIKSNNRYKIRASLYSSKEIIDRKAGRIQQGPIARLKKRSKNVDSFLSS